MTAGLIVNPHSGKGNRKGIALAQALQGVPGVEVFVLEHFDALPAAMRALAGKAAEDIYISSGDGTIQEIQTMLAEENLFASPPRLCLLPHGTTNMTAADIGLRTTSIASQAEFMRRRTYSDLAARPTLRVVNPRDRRIRHGMFLGAGAVTQASRFCQEAVHRSGLRGNFATAATLGTALLRAAISRPAPDDPGRIDRPHPLGVIADGVTKTSGPNLLVLLTTLDKLILGTKPFWGGKSAPLRGTVFPYPVPSMSRWLIPSLYGREDRKTPPGATSFSCQTCEISTSSQFIIDGEFFDPPADQPLRVETGPELTYIRG